MTEAEATSLMGLGGKLIGGLTPQFLALLVLNIAFLTGLFWLALKQSESRERALAPILTACAHSVPMESFQAVMQHLYRIEPPPAP
jgi:hypothetical protein